MTKEPLKIKAQNLDKRLKNYREVSSGFSKRLSQDEARSCPQCGEIPCRQACPLGVNIPEFIRLLREGDTSAALQKILEQNCLPGVCGRICLAPCEAACVINQNEYVLNIKALERFVADHGRHRRLVKKQKALGKKIAIIGSGPSGLVSAAELSLKGYQVTVFEIMHAPGGILRYAIPEFRLPKKILDREISDIQLLGVQIMTHYTFGRFVNIQDLFAQGFSVVLLALGAGQPEALPLKGKHLSGVYYAHELLVQCNLTKVKSLDSFSPFTIGDKIAVLGVNDLAFDCARICRRLGKDVSIISKESPEELNVHSQDLVFAQDEGVKFEGLTNPLEIVSNNNQFVSGLKCVRLDYADPLSTGHWQLIPVPESEVVLNFDTIFIAQGNSPNKHISQILPELKVQSNGVLWINKETGMTSCDDVFAVGDMIKGYSQLVQSMLAGKQVAQSIDQYLLLT